MRKRDQWIAIVFIAFVCIIPVVTFVRGFLPEKEQTTQESEVLNQNGTQAEDKTTVETVVVEDETKGFAHVQKQINTFTDRLFLKTKFIAFNTELTSAITGGEYIQSTQVLAGKNDFLFYKTQNDGFPIYDYMGINHFTEEELALMNQNLTNIRDVFLAQGIAFYAVGLPNKESVYEQYMPDTIARVNSQTRADQVAEYLWKNSDITYIYPKQELIEASKEEQIYYKTDTHWNQIGAFIGFQQFYEKAYGERQQVSDVHFRIDGEDFAGDLAVIAGITDKYGVDTIYCLESDSVDPKLKRDETIFVVGDSFGGFFSTMAKAYYTNVEWIDPKAFTMKMVEEKKPDVIVFECVERYIERLKDFNLVTM